MASRDNTDSDWEVVSNATTTAGASSAVAGLSLNSPPPAYSTADASSSSDIDISTLADVNTKTVLISFTPPPTNNRTPVDLCCVIDISGSMETEAEIKTDTGEVERNGLSVLDVVKHAMKTIIASLEPSDRLALVSFSDAARIEMNLTDMNPAGRKTATDVVEKLRTEGCTNLWDGLKTGMEVLQMGRDASTAGGRRSNPQPRVPSVMILTDGMPNIEPPRGSVAMLKQYMDLNHETGNCTVNTFGFGYSLDSKILHQLAIEGRGVYSFIPDAGMVGTAFINALSNLFVTMATNVKVSIETLNGAELKGSETDPLLGGHESSRTSWGVTLHLGSIMYGQSKDFILDFTHLPDNNKPYMNIKLEYDLWSAPANNKTAVKTIDNISGFASTPDALIYIASHTSRLQAIDVILSGVTTLASPSSSLPSASPTASIAATIQALIATLSTPSSNPSASHPTVSALLSDLSGQCLLAFSTQQYYTKWGRHYLPSLARAHLLQQCNNFKDPGVQVYGGEKFRALRDQLDAVFDSLPPPKPSRKQHQTTRNVKMSSYNRSSGPCFGGDSLVHLASGSQKRVKDIVKGDRVVTGSASVSYSGTSTTVACVLVTRVAAGKEWMCQLPGDGDGRLQITPWHPILHDGTWTFPEAVRRAEYVACEAVYSFLLAPSSEATGSTDHSVVINDVTCVTLGHGVVTSPPSIVGIENGNDNDVRAHAFLGDYGAVSSALREVDPKGWEVGRVECAGTRRDEETGLVCGFIPIEDDEAKKGVRRSGSSSSGNMPEIIVAPCREEAPWKDVRRTLSEVVVARGVIA